MDRLEMKQELRETIGRISDEDFEKVLDVVDDYAYDEYKAGRDDGASWGPM